MFVPCTRLVLECVRILKKIVNSGSNKETALVTFSGKEYPCDVGYLNEGLDVLEDMLRDSLVQEDL